MRMKYAYWFFLLSVALWSAAGTAQELCYFGDTAPSYYNLLKGDKQGGADGRAEFRWARRYAIAAVKLAAYRVFKEMGRAKFGPAIFDCSNEGGLTPFEIQGNGCRQRHPGSSHDGGVNLDIGYYLKDLKGKFYTPDYAACTDHFKGRKDAYRCLGKPDKLDVARQALFYVELFRIHLEWFRGQLLREVGIDEKVRKAVLEQLLRWEKHNKYGVTKALIKEIMQRWNSDPYEGWAWSHHHHTHLRFSALKEDGKMKQTIGLLVLKAIKNDLLKNGCTVQLCTFRGKRYAEVYCTRPFRAFMGSVVNDSYPFMDIYRVIFDLPFPYTEKKVKIEMGKRRLSLKVPKVPFLSASLVKPHKDLIGYKFTGERLIPQIPDYLRPFFTEIIFYPQCSGNNPVRLQYFGTKTSCKSGVIDFVWCKRRHFRIGVFSK